MNRQERAKELELTLEHGLFELEQDLACGFTERYLETLEFYSRFHHYSLTNAMLIREQLPTASRCAGMKKWNELGYKVKKGESALWIRAPWLRNEVNPQTGEIEKKLVGFYPVPIFDVSQLEGNPRLPSLTYELQGEFDELYTRAKADVICSGIIVLEGPMPRGLHGISWGGQITINESLSVSEKLATLWHELAHEVSDHKQRPLELSKTQKELEAESAAWLIGKLHNIPIPWSADYIRLYQGKVTDLHLSFRRITDIVTHCLKILRFDQLFEEELWPTKEQDTVAV